MWKDPFAVTTVLSSLLCSWSHKHSGSACCVTGLSSALSQLASWKKSPGAVPEHSTPPGMQELFWQELPGTRKRGELPACRLQSSLQLRSKEPVLLLLVTTPAPSPNSTGARNTDAARGLKCLTTASASHSLLLS